MAFLRNEVVRFVAGVVFAIISIFTFVSILSYLFTWAEDQSLLSEDNVLSNIVKAENIGGKIGFFSANLLVSKWFGLGAFIIPFFFAGVSVYCFRRGRIRLLRLLTLSLRWCIVLSAACSFIFSFTSADALFGDGAGGSYGYYINEWLVSMTGVFGAACIIFFFLVLWIILLNTRIVRRITGFFDSLFVHKGGDAEENPGEYGAEADGDEDLEEDGDDAEDGEEDDEDSGEDGEEEENDGDEELEEDGDGSVGEIVPKQPEGPVFEIIDQPVPAPVGTDAPVEEKPVQDSGAGQPGSAGGTAEPESGEGGAAPVVPPLQIISGPPAVFPAVRKDER